ncbi:MAG: AbrB/MazE/SpoVT family DNA-binding domain-containing protein [Roseitalea sp.]|jgi:AbrB family looped-hinge helix DNA binding protein|uniref:AbrB/MazE/SpoVT family DNA-binding domain-containing protein n=2 Tax=Oceaniradius stylonematis TaxID=2184161 RepID=A0A3A8A7I8_9HYPH|nr:AbrB/MazE/SpoVT family DNA-binding domain-containing protein [Oceaniradius stylonematis]MBO6551817.1 AbrB/MazE/SpoVT family DNA-binding domain-containing protein [Roseitalea sp.]MBO6951803.1 AbrB/MazE/SpoVT family DNA-binding domain-containing protein [Rhizobiaceae bacterium]RNC95764.1 MAG: AbrB/MazE/SpoVT family DNA-binding domain-containing protein [Oricola sp.]MBO6592351.1 AbrB/MazE/SpoVT family DNA-binding domain-containing protein [Roseitalea sp.]MBO6598606.1 AbrB/MazE/SpoVT family DNA
MGAFTTLTSKGQMTVPKEVREKLGLETGMRLHVSVKDGQMVVQPKNQKLSDLAGFLGRPPNGKSLRIEDIDEAIMDAVAEDDERIKRDWHRSQP